MSAPMIGDGVVRAVSAAKPQWHDVGGRQVFTSIVRSPSTRPIWFGPQGPEGNATAVHTEQVLAFSSEHYDHWARQLGVPRDAWDWCHWGENISLSGLDENQLTVGAVVAIGPRARFEVTSPRIPCFKLAWRIGQPDSVLAEMTATGWVGIYLRVLEPGEIGAGDMVRVESQAEAAITVGDLSRLLTDASVTDTALLRRVLANPALGGQARGMIRNRVARIEDQADARRDRWTGWRSFEVERVTDEARAVKSFHLRPADGGPLAPSLAGQFLTVRLPGPPDAPDLVRTWSLSDHDISGGAYRLTVKRLEGGTGSAALHDIAPGARIDVRPPAGRFTLDRSGFLRLVLISAGIGVTPMLAMLKAHAARGDEGPPVLWLHVARDGAAHVLAGEARQALEGTRFERHIFYTSPGEADAPGRDYDHAGRPTPERIEEILRSDYTLRPFGRDIELSGENADFYICGPAEFEAMVRQALGRMGAPPTHIRSEAFAAKARSGAGAAIASARVRFTASGREAEWSADDDLTLLELAESVGLTPSFSCRMGTCQTCETTLLRGDVAYDPAPAVDAAPGRALICAARPASAVVELDH
jgi:ferredoxin-NADP reductase/MOSC domain-containing protein YiiM